nr:hypothetical protein [Tanacetum cinerariifolium]
MPSPAIESTSDDAQNRNLSITETEASPSTISSKPFIKFVKAADKPTKNKTDKGETVRKPAVKYAELYKKPSKSSSIWGNQRNWNNLKSQQLGKNFVMKKKLVSTVVQHAMRGSISGNSIIYTTFFWSTARIETTEEGTKILATVDGKLMTVFESSIRRNLKLNDEAGISSLPDAKLFENLQLMGYNILPNQKFTFQKGQFSHQWKYLIHTIILKARIKLLEDKDRGVAAQSGDDAPIKGRKLDEGGTAPIFTTATESTPYTRRKGKEKMLQEQIDVQVARELEEQMTREDQRMSEQIARDAEVARIHAEEELQMMINSLDMSNETVAKYLQEYEQIPEDLSIGE